MYDLFYNSPKNSIMVWLLGRQSGKTYLLCILALEFALKTPNVIVKMVTDTKTHAESIIEPKFRELLHDCPVDLKPEYNKQKYTFNFYNGSQIQLAGTDGNHYEKLRGQKSVLVLVDEAGFCSDLDVVIRSVLLPTTTHTGGKLVLASTPPRESDHPFLGFIEEADMKGLLSKKTIYDNDMLTNEDIDRIISQMGGATSEMFRREYLCEIIKDSTTTVVPEFTAELEKEVVREWPKPPFLDSYVSMDLGGKDLTVVLFGYYDFRADKIIIEDEVVMDFRKADSNIKTLVDNILKKEDSLWTNPLTLETRPPYLRVSDINHIVLKDIADTSHYKLMFQVTKKDDKVSAVNMMRDYVQQKKIIINPRCETLVRHLRNVKWQKNDRTLFARSPDDGHYDAVDALIYLTRSIVFSKNPYPKGYDLNLRAADAFVVGASNSNVKRNSTMKPEHINIYRTVFGGKSKPIDPRSLIPGSSKKRN